MQPHCNEREKNNIKIVSCQTMFTFALWFLFIKGNHSAMPDEGYHQHPTGLIHIVSSFIGSNSNGRSAVLPICDRGSEPTLQCKYQHQCIYKNLSLSNDRCSTISCIGTVQMASTDCSQAVFPHFAILHLRL